MITKFRGEHFFLSNFYPCIVTYKGITYSSSEAAYQAQKTLDFNEKKEFSKLDPKTAKEKGQTVDKRTDWDDIKLEEMYHICKTKFLQN